MATEEDDEELTFDAEAPQAQPAPPKAQAETPATDPKPEASAAPAAESKPAEPAEPAAPASRKPSRSGMAIAACLGVCVLTSTLAAVQSWRAASIAAEASSAGSTKDVIAKLNALQTLMEQQRDAIDELSTRPGLAAAASPQSVDGQINALAAAVKANQQMTEQLPSVVMKQVNARLARTEPRRAAAPANARPQAARPAVQRSTAPKRPERTAEAAKVLSTPIVAAAAEKKRPAGEEISYP
ncbi:hypothetical protein [Sphingosinicella soli]|uniref:Uncharacterized protein n=1 Tax=Sphingosinicella soli TaxID=333708 RepID=A0A7W7F6R2_9SPHN|nr:hypothetical protein [Sphingosinicella soli]MBB4632825.1 hypothetical protein [Sphingosinicella soli]